MEADKTDAEVTHPPADTRSTSLMAIPAQPQSPSPRKIKRLAAVAGVLVVVALAASWWGLHSGGGLPRTAVEALVSGPVERVLAVSGRTDTDVHSDIRSLVTARVAEVKVREGDTVAAGDELLILEASQQNSRVRQALAALDAAILREQSAQADRDRAVSLGATMSAVEIANAERDLALAAAEVSRLQAALEQAQLSLPDYKITAPMSGVVLNRSVEPGDLVSPPDVLMRLADSRKLYVRVQVDEIYADKIRIGQRAWLQLTGRTETTPGVVSFVAAEVDELTGSLRVKLTFDTIPDAQIGLTTLANIRIDTVPEAVTVPRSAFVASRSGTAVFILRDGRARLTPITVVDWPADRVEVTSGLTEGDRVVLSPEGVEDGQPLAAQDSPAASD